MDSLAQLQHDLECAHRLLIIRLRSLGDSILALPLLEAIHSWRRELEVDILVESPYAAVFAGHPVVHDILQTRPGKRRRGPGWSRARACLELRRRRYDAVLNLHGGSTSWLFTAATGARIRIGQEKYRNGWIYTARIPAPARVWQRNDLHTVEDQLTLFPWLGLPYQGEPRGRLYVDPSVRERMLERLRDAGIERGNYVLIHPTATLATKQWKEENFAQLADRLKGRYKCPVIFSSAPDEAQVLLNVGRHALQAHRYWCDLGLAKLFALIESCRLFIGNDSGPTHAAAALDRPLVVVWGSSDFRVWHPWKTAYETVRQDLPCMPCPGYTCAAFGEPKCINDIPVELVERACERVLSPEC